jgi:preprotein translocase subunit Sec61beta
MSMRQPKKKNSAPMPSTGAGLMRYFDEELPGRKIGANFVLIYTSILILVVLWLNTSLNPFSI